MNVGSFFCLILEKDRKKDVRLHTAHRDKQHPKLINPSYFCPSFEQKIMAAPRIKVNALPGENETRIGFVSSKGASGDDCCACT